MLTWTFPKSQNLPNLKIFSQDLGKSTSAFQNLTQISEISNPKFSQILSAQLQLLRKLHPVACCVCRALKGYVITVYHKDENPDFGVAVWWAKICL